MFFQDEGDGATEAGLEGVVYGDDLGFGHADAPVPHGGDDDGVNTWPDARNFADDGDHVGFETRNEHCQAASEIARGCLDCFDGAGVSIF